MKREDFVFTIGYQGSIAVVNATARKKFAKLSTLELAGKGLYSQAFRSAVYSADEQEMEELIEYFRAQHHASGGFAAGTQAPVRRFCGTGRYREDYGGVGRC